MSTDDRREVSGGAAHIERDGILDTKPRTQIHRRRDAAREARCQHMRRVGAGRPRCGDTAIRAHELQRAPETDPLKQALKLVEVARDDRPHIGGHRRGAGARPFLKLRVHLMRAIDGKIGQARGDGLLQHCLMRGMKKGKDKRDGNRLGPPPRHLIGNARGLQFGQSRHGRPEGVHTLMHLDHVRAGDDGEGLVLLQRIGPGPHLAADLEHIGEALRRHQQGLGTRPHQERIGGNREAMDEEPDLRNADPCACRNAFDTGCDALGTATRASRDFVDKHRSLPRIDEHKIGEGSSNIGGKRDHSAALCA